MTLTGYELEKLEQLNLGVGGVYRGFLGMIEYHRYRVHSLVLLSRENVVSPTR
jgi:hypothetical protein